MNKVKSKVFKAFIVIIRESRSEKENIDTIKEYRTEEEARKFFNKLVSDANIMHLTSVAFFKLIDSVEGWG